MTLDRSIGDDRTLRVSVKADAVADVIRKAPRAAYFWLRAYLFRSFVAHRLRWFANKGIGFGRGGEGIKVHQINKGPVPPGPKEVTYSVRPEADKMPTPAAATQGLNELVGEAFTGNLVLPVHEFGTVIRSKGKMLALPVRTRPGTPALWKLKTGKKLVARPSKRDDSILLFESRGGRRPRGGKQGPATRDKLKLRFILTRRPLQMKPTLRMYATWDELRAERDALWGRTATKMTEQMARGRVD